MMMMMMMMLNTKSLNSHNEPNRERLNAYGQAVAIGFWAYFGLVQKVAFYTSTGRILELQERRN